MSILRRYDPQNRPVFITCVTLHREPLLLNLIQPLIRSYCHIRKLGVNPMAWVVMPDHLHAIVELGDNSLSNVVHRFKRKLSASCYSQNVRQRIWQHRFWDHIIRNQNDLNRHIDYIHYNPVKHDLVSDALKWKWSSLQRWKSEAYFRPDWGRIEQESGDEFGE